MGENGGVTAPKKVTDTEAIEYVKWVQAFFLVNK